MKKRLLKQTIKIKDLGKVITGTTPPTVNKAYFGGHYLFIKPSDISEDQRYIFETEMTLSNLGYEYQSIKALPKTLFVLFVLVQLARKYVLLAKLVLPISN
jgi:type I restriction enzyme S subunit